MRSASVALIGGDRLASPRTRWRTATVDVDASRCIARNTSQSQLARMQGTRVPRASFRTRAVTAALHALENPRPRLRCRDRADQGDMMAASGRLMDGLIARNS